MNSMNWAVSDVIYEIRHIDLRFKMMNLTQDVEEKYQHARAMARRANSIMSGELYPVILTPKPDMNPRLIVRVKRQNYDYIDMGN